MALLAGLAAWLLLPPHRVVRLRRMLMAGLRRPHPPEPRLIGAGLAALGVVVLLDPPLSLLLAPAAAIGAHRLLDRLETAAERARRAALVRELPLFADLVVAALEAGRPPEQALDLASGAVGGVVRAEIEPFVRRAEVGGDLAGAWRAMADHRDLGLLGRTLLRSSVSGAPVSRVLSRTAAELRRDARAEAQRAARGVGVRTAGPLGACFLPAFLLVGVIPTIVSGFQTVLG